MKQDHPRSLAYSLLIIPFFIMACSPGGYSESSFERSEDYVESKGRHSSFGGHDIGAIIWLDEGQDDPTEGQKALLSKVTANLKTAFDQHKSQIPKDCLEFKEFPDAYDDLTGWTISIEAPSSVEDYNWTLDCLSLTEHGQIEYSAQFKDLKIIEVAPTY